jgi:hypothetical protein
MGNGTLRKECRASRVLIGMFRARELNAMVLRTGCDGSENLLSPCLNERPEQTHLSSSLFMPPSDSRG